LKRAAKHRGTGFIEILQNCNVYNDLAWNVIYDRESKVQHELRLEHGKPLLSGPPDDRRALIMEGRDSEGVRAKDVPESTLWIHDETNVNAAKLLAISSRRTSRSGRVLTGRRGPGVRGPHARAGSRALAIVARATSADAASDTCSSMRSSYTGASTAVSTPTGIGKSGAKDRPGAWRRSRSSRRGSRGCFPARPGANHLRSHALHDQGAPVVRRAEEQRLAVLEPELVPGTLDSRRR